MNVRTRHPARRMLTAVAVAVLAMAGCRANEESVVEDDTVIDEDTTWGKDLVLAGIVSVEEGVTLTVKPGVQVGFRAGSGLYVGGNLKLKGTERSLVRFYNTTSLSSGPFGVFVGGQGDKSNIQHALFAGVDLELEGGATSEVQNVEFRDANLVARWREEPFVVSDCEFSDDGQASGFRLETEGVEALTITATTVDGGHEGMHLVGDGTALLDDVEVKDSRSHGVYIDGLDTTLMALEVDDTGSDGLHGTDNSDLVVQGATITDCTNDCIDARGGLTVDGAMVDGCGDQGIEGGEDVVISNTLVTNVGSHGIEVMDATITHTTVSGSDARGIHLSGEGESLIDYCLVTGNGAEGIRGATGDENLLQVTNSNLVGNSEWAVREALDLQGCYVADNNGWTGPDLEAGNAPSGDRDLMTAQVANVVTIADPQPMPIPTAGSPDAGKPTRR